MCTAGNFEIFQPSSLGEGDVTGKHFSLLIIHSIPAHHHRNPGTKSHQITVPHGNISIGFPPRNWKHYDGTWGWQKKSFSQRTQSFLSASVPTIEFHFTLVRWEGEGTNAHPQGAIISRCDFGRIKLFDEGLEDSHESSDWRIKWILNTYCFPNTSISNDYNFEFRDIFVLPSIWVLCRRKAREESYHYFRDPNYNLWREEDKGHRKHPNSGFFRDRTPSEFSVNHDNLIDNSEK